MFLRVRDDAGHPRAQLLADDADCLGSRERIGPSLSASCGTHLDGETSRQGDVSRTRHDTGKLPR